MTEGTPQPQAPVATLQGNAFLNGTLGAGATSVITGYREESLSIPYFLAKPGSNLGGVTGMFPQPSSLQYESGQTRMVAQRTSVDAILQDLARLDATDPEAYKEKVDLLKDTRFTNWKDFFDSAAYSDMPWEEYLAYRAQTDRDLYGDGGGGGPFRSTQSTTTLSSESDAARIVDEVYRNYLGRTASDEEVTAFQEVLNAAQRANPSTATTTGYRGSSNSSSNTVQTTGFDPARFAREYAQSQEGYAERLAGITFMDAIDNVIRSAAGSLDEFAGTIQ
jgi:hypothetical protein